MIAPIRPAALRTQILSLRRTDMSTPQEDVAYFQRRFADCTEQAHRATCCSSRRAHEELARLYHEQLDLLGAQTARDTEITDANPGPGHLVKTTDSMR